VIRKRIAGGGRHLEEAESDAQVAIRHFALNLLQLFDWFTRIQDHSDQNPLMGVHDHLSGHQGI
jgi:hypothetical protein